MVTFLECPGPYSSIDVTGNTPICNECSGSVSKPCPFNDTICSCHSKTLEQTPEQCKSASCNCCLKSVKSEHIKNSISCQCCDEHLTDKNNSIPSTEHYNCPWCAGGFVIYRKDVEKNVKEDHQSSSKLDQKMVNRKHCCNCIHSSRIPNEFCNPHSVQVNKLTECPKCPFVRQEVNNAGYHSPEYNKPANSKMDISETKTGCKPVRSAIIIGGKMVICGCNRRNGLQDDCRL